jgi:hypothetical protein
MVLLLPASSLPVTEVIHALGDLLHHALELVTRATLLAGGAEPGIRCAHRQVSPRPQQIWLVAARYRTFAPPYCNDAMIASHSMIQP